MRKEVRQRRLIETFTKEQVLEALQKQFNLPKFTSMSLRDNEDREIHQFNVKCSFREKACIHCDADKIKTRISASGS